MTSTPISDASQQEHNTNESREQPAQQSPSSQQNSTSNETQDQQLEAEEPPPRLIPETSKTPSFTNSDKYIPVTARFHEAIKLATSHVNNESTKSLAHAVLNNWGDTLVNKLRYISEELMRIEEDYNNGCTDSDELDWYKTTLAELAPYGILSSKDSHDIVELLNNDDCEGRSLLLSVLFSCFSRQRDQGRMDINRHSSNPTTYFHPKLLRNDRYLRKH
jgi:hypothetical protein